MHNFSVIAKTALDTDLFWVHSNGAIWHQHTKTNDLDRRFLIAPSGAVHKNGNIAAVECGNKINLFWVNRLGVLCSRYLDSMDGQWGEPYDVSNSRSSQADRQSSLCAITPNENQIYLFWVDRVGAIWVNEWNNHQSAHWKESVRVTGPQTVSTGSSLTAVARGNRINVFWINQVGALCSCYLGSIDAPWGRPYSVNVNNGQVGRADRQSGICAITPNENQMYVFWTDEEGTIRVNEYNNRIWKEPISISVSNTVSAGSKLTGVIRNQMIHVFWINQYGLPCSSYLQDGEAQWAAPYDIGNSAVVRVGLQSNIVAAVVPDPVLLNMSVFHADELGNIWVNRWPLADNLLGNIPANLYQWNFPIEIVKLNTIRLVEHVKVIDWKILLQTDQTGIEHQNRFNMLMGIFFKEFKHFRLKIGNDIVLSNTNDLPKLLDILRQRISTDSHYRPFGSELLDDITNRSNDILAALTDPETDGLWMQGGGNPGNPIENERYMTELIYKIHQKSININAIIHEPKPIVGYCFAVPLLIYLSSRNLAKAIHGPVFYEIVGMLAFEGAIDRLKNLFLNKADTQRFTEVTTCNERAQEILRGEHLPSGLVIGGLLQIVIHSLQVALVVERHLGIGIISNKPILLFVELLDFNDEIERFNELSNLIRDNNLRIKAFTLGSVYPNMNMGAQHVAEYRNRVDERWNHISQSFDLEDIAVMKGLKVGHVAPNEPILFGLAEMSFNNNMLELNYSTQVLDMLNLPGNSLWQREESRGGVVDIPNNLEQLCMIQ